MRFIHIQYPYAWEQSGRPLNKRHPDYIHLARTTPDSVGLAPSSLISFRPTHQNSAALPVIFTLHRRKHFATSFVTTSAEMASHELQTLAQ